MQQLNHYTLCALAGWLQDALCEGRCIEAFTQEADELVLLCKGGRAGARAVFIRISTDANLPHCVPVADYRRARTNSVNLLRAAEQKTITQIWVPAQERLLVFDLEDSYQLVIKLHGTRSNVLLLHEGFATEMFRSQLTDDLRFTLPAEREPVAVEDTFLANGKPTPALKNAYPALDKYLMAQVLKLLHGGETLPDSIAKSIEVATSPPYYVTNTPAGFWLLPPDEPHTQYENIAEALQAWLKLALRGAGYQAQVTERIKAVAAEMEKLEARQRNNRKSLEKLTTARSPEELGHIVLANLHKFIPGENTILADDPYTASTLTLKHNQGETPQQLAERYYVQHHKQQQESTQLEKHLQELATARTALAAEQLALAAIHTAADWKRYQQQYSIVKRTPQAAQAHTPYRTFVYQGYTILVGKGAADNDALTVQHARKEDLWLHARDVSGSHVVVRRRPGQQGDYPKPVLEYAAGLAAWYSKQRTSGLAPVSYTLRKYVRKNKTMPPGQVVLMQEKTLLVPPLDPKTTEEG